MNSCPNSDGNRDGAWIEASLKGVFGVGLGAAGYYGLTAIPESVQVPFPQLAGTHTLAALPALFAPAIAGVYWALVELDNSGAEAPPASSM